MWLSTKGRYGLKAMLDLALHNGEGPVALKSIAERQNLPENYLEQLFATLKKAGHITSVRVHREAICFPKTLTVLQ